MAAALASAVLPSLAVGSQEEERLGRLRRLFQDRPAPEHAALAAQAVRLGAVSPDEAADSLVQAIASRERRLLEAAVWAIGEWSVLHDGGRVVLPPRRLLDEVITLVMLRVTEAMPEALRTARVLARRGLLTPADASRLAIGLRHLLAETDYAGWAGDDEQTARLTVIRADAVRLFSVLVECGLGSEAAERWLAAAELDVLPEARFATATDDDGPE